MLNVVPRLGLPVAGVAIAGSLAGFMPAAAAHPAVGRGGNPIECSSGTPQTSHFDFSKMKAKIGAPKYHAGRVPVTLINHTDRCQEFIVFDSRNHFYSQDFADAGKTVVTRAPIKKHGHSSVRIYIKHHTFAKKKFNHK